MLLLSNTFLYSACIFENGVDIAHGIIHGNLEINNCEFKNNLRINNVEVRKDIIIENDIKIHTGIEIEELRATQLKMNDIKSQNQDEKSDNAFKTSGVIPRYKSVTLKEVKLSSQLRFEYLNVPLINIDDSNVESCIIKNNNVDKIEVHNMHVNTISYIDFNFTSMERIKLIDSNLGQHVRLMPSCNPKIELTGTVANYDSLPPANDMLLMLQDSSRISENRQTLAMLHRAYETSGAPYDTKVVREKMLKFDLDNCNLSEKPRLMFLYYLTKRNADLYILAFWCSGGIIGFVCMIFSQKISKKKQIIIEYPENDKIPSYGLCDKKFSTIIKSAFIASLEGMMPIQHIFGKHRCFGFSYFVYACLKIMSWGVMMLYVRAFTM